MRYGTAQEEARGPLLRSFVLLPMAALISRVEESGFAALPPKNELGGRGYDISSVGRYYWFLAFCRTYALGV